MEYAATLTHELSLLKEKTIVAIEENLKRIGTAHKIEDESPLEFFSFKATEENSIIGINADGSLMLAISPDYSKEFTVRQYIEDDIIPLDEAIYLLEDLEQI